MITVAPEEDRDLVFIRQASRLCTVSLGHSVADYEMAQAAFEAGATHVTHMFNGMNGIHHGSRESLVLHLMQVLPSN